MNPYDWKRHRPRVEVPRAAVDAMADELRDGTSGVLLAGRGMGKSVFLRQVARRLESLDDVRVALFAESPARLTVASCLEALAQELGVDVPGALHASDVLAAYSRREDVPERLVLLYDELDRYARSPEGRLADPPGRSFFNSLESARRDTPELGVLAAGSIGVFAFRDVLGSSFLARADKVRIAPSDPTRPRSRRQVESYGSADVTAAAVVMLTDAELPDWPELYRRSVPGSPRRRRQPTACRSRSTTFSCGCLGVVDRSVGKSACRFRMLV